MSTIVKAIKNILTGRDALVQRLADLAAQHAAAGLARARAIEAAEAERAKITEILDRPARLRAEVASLGATEQAEEANLENELRASPSRELAKFAALVDRLYQRLRAMNPPQALEHYNQITEERRVINLAAIETHLALGPTLVQIRGEVHRDLWRLDSVALQERLTVLRHALDTALEGTALEDEAA